jgi:hypothetical protein
MKLQIATITLLAAASSCDAFTISTGITTSSSRTSSLQMSKNDNTNRRDAISTLFSGIAASATVTATLLPQVAQAARREPLPEYLTEPTDEFKESERQRDEFRRQQLAVKREFNTVLDRLTFESKSEEELINDLKELRYLVIKTEGLPLGIKKDEMVKIIRAKKAKGFWPTNVEIAYQKLTAEIAYQQSPNREKDMSNPL